MADTASRHERADPSECPGCGCGCGLVRIVLGELSLRWPSSVDLDPQAVGLEGDGRNREFVRIMQALLDQGFITFEGVERKAGTPRFLDVLVTPSGRAALKVMRFLATLR